MRNILNFLILKILKIVSDPILLKYKMFLGENLKGTVSIAFSDTLCIIDNARSTMYNETFIS